jgi:hypothetical protein
VPRVAGPRVDVAAGAGAAADGVPAGAADGFHSGTVHGLPDLSR